MVVSLVAYEAIDCWVDHKLTSLYLQSTVKVWLCLHPSLYTQLKQTTSQSCQWMQCTPCWYHCSHISIICECDGVVPSLVLQAQVGGLWKRAWYILFT